MKFAALFGLVAMIPATLYAGQAAAMLTVPICTGDGQVHSITIPMTPSAPGKEQSPCCAKGCHSGNSRKRILQEIDPSQ
jgi:hypothetical protein